MQCETYTLKIVNKCNCYCNICYFADLLIALKFDSAADLRFDSISIQSIYPMLHGKEKNCRSTFLIATNLRKQGTSSSKLHFLLNYHNKNAR